MKKIPIGIDQFDKLIQENYYFADKSLLIRDLFEKESAEVVLIPRPRRFGKSLNISMMNCFFSLKDAEKNHELFKGLKIEQESIMAKQGKYPVIYLSFKDVKELSWEHCYNTTKDLIQRLFNSFDYLLKFPAMSKFEKISFEKILLGEGTQSNFENSLKFLCELLYKYHQVKPIILIDEYDQPLISAYTNGFYKEGVSFYRNFLSAALKDNACLEKGVLTGILRVAKESIFSGLNNLKVDSILRNQFNYFGLCEDEVKAMLDHFSQDYEIDDVKDWYNGYTFGEHQVYNPWSIINFVDAKKLRPYWVNTSSNDLIREALSNLSKSNYAQLNQLMEGKSVRVHIEENIAFDMLDNPEVIWNLMLFSGYLSLTLEEKVRFPNREVRNFYIEEFKRLAAHSINSFNTLTGFLLKKDLKNFQGLLQEMFYRAVSYYDVGTEEKYYHNLMLGLVFGLDEYYHVHSNREYGTGRVDLALKSRNEKHPDYIFEFKVSKQKKDLIKDCEKALAQIEEKKYGIEMTDPVKIGMSFYGKEFEIRVV